MNPFFFGSSQRPLFGVYHPPRSRTPRPTGIVLCYPFGQEYMRAHRAFRQLANLLAKAGFPVLRFDYFGTGDSGGEGEEAEVAQWIADIGAAVEELKDTAGVTKVSIVGLRLGATLAAMAAATRKDVDRIVLWDPVVEGAEYVEALLRNRHSPFSNVPAHIANRVPRPDETIGTLGFPLTPALRSGLAGLDLGSITAPAAGRLTMIVSEERDEYVRLRTKLGERRVPSTFQHVASAGNWAEVDKYGAALLPQEIIQGIVTTLSGGGAS